MTALLPELVLDRARECPESPAVVFDGGQLTYRELAGTARRVAAGLAARGVGVESTVGVLVSPGPDMVACVLGIWLAGACYVPLDPMAPARRLRDVVESANLRVVVTDEPEPAGPAGLPASTTLCEVSRLIRSSDPGSLPHRVTTPRQAAYLIFTSGSTGTPKGVVIEHEGIANRVRWGVRALGLSPADRVLQKTPLTFDAAGWEIFAPLICGAPVTFGRPHAGRDPGSLVGSIRDRQATVVQVVPTMLRLLAAEPGLESCTSLRVICSAGEALSAELCQRVLERVEVEILNTYGPTECSIDVLAAWFDPAQRSGPVAIGRPIDNTRVWLPPERNGAAADAPGRELYAGGLGVARGYHGDPARTAEYFVPDPSGPPGARMYRTGDLVRTRADGAIEFIGRSDEQVKINGVRVELGEIEVALETHPDVIEAAVRAVTDSDGVSRLAAWVVTSRPGSAERVDAYLRDRLPLTMIPAIIGELDTLPRTTSGKTDRARLPEPDLARATVPGRATSPATAEVRIVLAAWRQLLGVEEIGLDDDFFRVGGHSLLMARLAATLTETSGLELDFRELHFASTVRRQAQLLEVAAKARPIAQLGPRARLPLSHAQERFWLLDQVDPGSREYLLPILVWLPAEVPERVVRAALDWLMARHEVLRSRYVMDAEGLTAVVEPSGGPGAVPLRSVETTPDQVGKIVAEELSTGFDLRRAPLFRASLVRDGGAEQLLLLVCHHIVCDGWSARILEQQLRESVEAILAGRAPDPPEPALRYVDAVAWQRANLTDDVLAEQLGYWRAKLADLPTLELPAMRQRDPLRRIDGAAVWVEIPSEVVTKLLATGRRAGATPYAVLLTLWTIALARASGQWDFGIGSPHAGRTRSELHDLVGPFLNTVVVRSGLTPRMSFAAALDEVARTSREGFARHTVPFEAVVDAVGWPRNLGRTPLFDAFFLFAGDDLVGQRRRKRDLDLLEQAWTVAHTDLALTLWPHPDGGYFGAVEYSTALYDEATATGLAHRLRTLAEHFADDPERAVGATLVEAGDAVNGSRAALSPHQETVLRFIRDLLEQPDVGLDDDVMAHGGNSRMVARLLWHVQTTFGVEVPMRTFFDHPTAARLADEVERLVRLGSMPGCPARARRRRTPDGAGSVREQA